MNSLAISNETPFDRVQVENACANRLGCFRSLVLVLGVVLGWWFSCVVCNGVSCVLVLFNVAA